MTTISTDSFLTQLKDSKILAANELADIEKVISRSPNLTVDHLSESLIEKNLLTTFQKEKLFKRRGDSLHLWVYTLLEPLDPEGEGSVCRAKDKRNREEVVLKFLPERGSGVLVRSWKQMQTYRDFKHPGVANIYYLGQIKNRYFLVRKYFPGKTLQEMVQRGEKISYQKTATIGYEVALALQMCHEKGLVHGLLKPTDILLTPSDQTIVLDVGMAFLMSSKQGQSFVDTFTISNHLSAAIDYASPEAIVNPAELQASGDQYSLGCILYTCLTGRVPFPQVKMMEKMAAHSYDVPPAIESICPDCPQGLANVVRRMMEKTPGKRYANMDVVAKALQPWVDKNKIRSNSSLPGSSLHDTVQIRVGGSTTSIPRPPVINSSTNPAMWMGVGMGVMALLGGLMMLMAR